MYKVNVSRKLQKIIKKLSKHKADILEKKMIRIAHNPSHYKNLRYGFKQYKRVHIGHHVLIFIMDEKKKVVYFEDFQHHDEIYRR